MIAFLQRRHARAHIDHNSSPLVAQDGRERTLGIIARQCKGIGVADPCGFNLHQHLARARTVELHGVDDQGFSGPNGDGSTNVHKKLSKPLK